MSGSSVRVLYVLGIYHSGTTLLSNVAGQLDGYFSAGELRSVWRKSELPGARCGCGQALSGCEVWSPILRAVLGEGPDRAALAAEMQRCQREAVGELHTWLRVPSLLRKRGRDLPAGSALARYARGLARMYQAIAAETGSEVVVDCSKEPSDAAMLLLMPEIDATFVQIVRDPRGTVNSILRVRDDQRTVAARQLRHSAYAAFSWSAGNAAAAAVRRAAGQDRSMLLRYEEFVAEPDQTIQALARLAGRPAPLPAALQTGTVHLRPVHTVGGNNNRFRTGPIQFREDTAWRSQLHPVDRAAVTAVCAPLMTRYGYRLVP